MTRVLILIVLALALTGCGGDASSETPEPVSPGTHWIDLGDDVAVTVRSFEHEGKTITCVFSYESYHGTSSGLDCPEWLNRQ